MTTRTPVGVNRSSQRETKAMRRNTMRSKLLGVVAGALAATALLVGPALSTAADDVVQEFKVLPAQIEAKTDVAKTDKPADKDTAGLGQRRDSEVTVAEQLSFREQQVEEEMSELEQRHAAAVAGLAKART